MATVFDKFTDEYTLAMAEKIAATAEARRGERPPTGWHASPHPTSSSDLDARTDECVTLRRDPEPGA